MSETKIWDLKYQDTVGVEYNWADKRDNELYLSFIAKDDSRGVVLSSEDAIDIANHILKLAGSEAVVLTDVEKEALKSAALEADYNLGFRASKREQAKVDLSDRENELAQAQDRADKLSRWK